MSSNVCNINCNELQRILSNLSDSDQRKTIMLQSLRAGAKVLAENTKTNMIKKLGESATKTSDRIKKPMTDAVHITVDKDYGLVVVSILKQHTAKWFEMGTDQRYLKKDRPADATHHRTYKKGEHRGSITATNFFAEARQDDTPICDAIVETLAKQIEKLMK